MTENAIVSKAPTMLGERDAACYIGMSACWLRKLRYAGDPRGPKYLRLGHSVKYRVSDLDEWLEARTIDPALRFRSAFDER